MEQIAITLYKKVIDSTSKQAHKESKEIHSECSSDELSYPQAKLDIDEIYLDKEEDLIHISGPVYIESQILGHFYFDIPLSLKLSTDIVSHQMTKLERLKQVLLGVK